MSEFEDFRGTRAEQLGMENEHLAHVAMTSSRVCDHGDKAIISDYNNEVNQLRVC